MQFNDPNPISTNSCRSARRGATVVEYIVVVCLVGGGIICGVVNMAACGKKYEEVAARLCDIQTNDSSDAIPDSIRTSLSTSGEREPTSVLSNTHVLAMFLLIALLATALLYARLALRRHAENVEAAANNESNKIAPCPTLSAALEQVFRKRNQMRQQLDERWVGLVDGCGIAGDFMSTSLFTILPGTSISDAKQLLQEKGFRRVLVVTKDGKLAGIVSKKDLAQKDGECVSEVMTSDPIVSAPDMRISHALSIMLKNRISCMPVVQDGYLVGLLSTSDLMMLLQCVLLTLEEKHGNMHIHTDCQKNHAFRVEVDAALSHLVATETVQA